MSYHSAYLLHYTTHLFFDIYPLYREEYRDKSINRRASNDYTIQIVELSYDSLGYVLSKIGLKPKQVKSRRFQQANQEQVVPERVSAALIELVAERNKAVHENISVTKALMLYDSLINYVSIGYVMFHLMTHYEFCLSNPTASLTESCVVIDRAYLIRELEQNIGDTIPLKQAKYKLEHEGSIPTYTLKLSEMTKRILRNQGS